MDTVQAERLDNADQLGQQLVRFLRLLERAHAHFSHNTNGVEKASYVLLARLVIDGPQRAGTLAEAVHSDPSTISRQIAGLVRAGLVTRQADPLDGRATLLVATEEGVRTFQAARTERTRHIDVLLANWPTPRRKLLVELLDEFNSDIEKYQPQLATAIAEQREATR
ncbi:hypothetical protein GCM10010174_26700 [Kutzneria viridogrisea]|uniref:HTH marR-type domain-containing protein n=2 Tax=Kutzneria TaxID=43356 RepID=W5WM84_9PSEU|nr:MarR family transcriptional regulator [Kutzneria albida]AHI01983.1 hypothetical protein KALB_8626 [Kutzneria albida DSM 43870]MBA8929594.1 DNA-binding MarR family transcriptional regulator [Kutzneria viridogrisea]